MGKKILNYEIPELFGHFVIFQELLYLKKYGTFLTVFSAYVCCEDD